MDVKFGSNYYLKVGLSNYSGPSSLKLMISSITKEADSKNLLIIFIKLIKDTPIIFEPES
jgi:hypothetical protein